LPPARKSISKRDPLQFPGNRSSEVNAIALRNYTLTTQVSNIGRKSAKTQ
jgi:hypothetical protein